MTDHQHSDALEPGMTRRVKRSPSTTRRSIAGHTATVLHVLHCHDPDKCYAVVDVAGLKTITVRLSDLRP